MVIPIAMSLTAAGLGGCGDDTAAVAMVPSSLGGLTDSIDTALAGDIDWVIAGSSRLVRQLADGATADVLITADAETMADAVELGVVTGEPAIIARNSLVVALAPGNPAGIAALGDLADSSLLLGVCADEVPCGRLATEVQDALGFEVAIDTQEPNVRSLALKIATGELDAGLVYATDAADLELGTLGDDRLDGFVTEYLAADLGTGSSPLISFLLSDEGRALLIDQGFRVP